MTQQRTAVAVLHRLPPAADGEIRSKPVRVLTVAWSHVLTTAAVLSLANSYWAVFLRDVSGPVARTDASLVWLRDATVLFPWYVVAVLAAAALVPGRRGRAGRLAAPLLLPLCLAVTGAAALVGVVSLAGSTAYHVAGALQVASVARGSVLVVLTDAVLVGLLVAFDGGRLPLVRAAEPAAGAGDGSARASQPGVPLAATLLGSAVVHAAVIPEHLGHWALQAEFFWLLVMAQSVAGVLVLRMQRTGLLLAVAALSLGTVIVWGVSRTTGLPFGPEAWVAEPVGIADLAATTLELASLGLALTLLRGGTVRSAASSHVRALGLAAVVAVTVIGAAGTTLPVLGAFPPATPAHGAGDHTSPGS